MRIGTKDITNVLLGSKQLVRIYKGGTEIWSGYQMLTSLTNTKGSKGLDTGCVMTEDTEIEVSFQAGKTSDYAALWCSRGADTQTDTCTVFVASGGGFLRLDYGQATQVGTFTLTAGTTYAVKFSSGSFYVNGTQVLDAASKQHINNYGFPIGLFNAFLASVEKVGSGSASTTFPFTLPLYYCKIWQGGSLVRDLRPAKRLSDGKVGLLDKVSNQLYTSVDGVELVGA